MRIFTREATASERKVLELDPGVPVLVVEHVDGEVEVSPGDAAFSKGDPPDA
jgi:hypothetical protein